MEATTTLPTAALVETQHRTRSARAARIRSKIYIRLAQVGVAVLGIVVWHLAAVNEWGRPLYVSSPSKVRDFLFATVRSGEMWRNLSVTLKATLIAFVIATIAGVVVGLVLSMLPRLDAVLAPFISAANSLPRIALAPLFLLFFGIGIESKIALAVSIVFFILLVSAQAGVKGADQDIMKMAEMLDLGKMKQFTKILFPLAVPSIFAGVRLGIVYSLLGVVTGEIIAARAGIGQMIISYSGRFRIDGVYGCLFVLALVAAALNTIAGLIERRLLRWAPSTITRK